MEVQQISSWSILCTKICSPGLAISSAFDTHAFRILVTSSSRFSPSVLITNGCIHSSIVAFFQSIFGWNAASHGYPKTISSPPNSVTRNLICFFWFPHLICRSMKFLMCPALLWVPSMFQIVLGFLSGSFPIFIHFRSFSLIKFSMAPESTSTCRSAIECAVLNRVGIRRLLYLHLNTLVTPKARAQADGSAPFKNPLRTPLFLSTPLCLFPERWRPDSRISRHPILWPRRRGLS